MQKHPDSKYHIVRISLNDLNLKRSYEELRDTYGKEANPMENPRLKKMWLKNTGEEQELKSSMLSHLNMLSELNKR